MKYIIFFLLSLALSALLTPLVTIIAVRAGYIVEPRQDRWHTKPIPMLGGIAIALSCLVPALFAFGLSKTVLPLLIGAILIFFLGLADDLRGLSPQLKFLGQICITALLVSMGVVVEIIPYPVIAIPVTFLWIVGLTNSFNLLDNMDGLSAGVAAICALSLFSFSLGANDDPVALFAIILAGSCIGFLFYNFNPARIFMGDCGSMFLGFTLAATALVGTWQHASGLAVILFVPLLIVGIPIFDTAYVTFMRKVKGQPISQGGKDHVSHRLVAMGLSERKAVLLLYCLSAIFGLAAFFYNRIDPLVLGVCATLLIIGLFYFGLYLVQTEKIQLQKAAWASKPLRVSIRSFIELSIDLLLISVAYFAAYLLRFEGEMSPSRVASFVETLPILVVVKISMFYYFGLYRTIWRHVGVRDFINIVKAVFSSSLLIIGIIVMYARFQYFSRAVFVVDALLTLFFISGARFSLKILKEYLEGLPVSGKRVLIVGAGDGGELALREIRNNPVLKHHIVGFIDDDPLKRKRRIHGVLVLGGVDDLGQVSKKTGAQEVIIAIPSASEGCIKRVVQICEKLDLTWETFSPSGRALH